MGTITLSAPTDWSSSASTAIAAAIIAAGVGGAIYFPPGIYRITEPIVPLAGQTLYGDAYSTTILRIDFSAVLNFPTKSLVFKNVVGGVLQNPYVSVRGLTIDGGRNQSGRPNPTSKEDPLGYGADCPYGYAGGISLGVGWVVSKCRITNINGPKTGCFSAHDARIEYCRFDNDNGGTAGVEDNIGGGSVTRLELIGNEIAPNCWGSGIDITTGGDLRIVGNRIGFRSLILEGIRGAVVQDNVIYREVQDSDAGSINIKSNTQYASAELSGAWCSTDVKVIGNTVVNSNVPGIIINSTWDDKGPGDAKDGMRYCQAKGIEVHDNTIIRPLGLGVFAGGQNRARASKHLVVDNNLIIDPRQGTGGDGTEWSSGVGYFKTSGVGLGSGDGVVITRNTVLRTSSNSAAVASPVINGARAASQTPINTVIVGNSVVDQ